MTSSRDTPAGPSVGPAAERAETPLPDGDRTRVEPAGPSQPGAVPSPADPGETLPIACPLPPPADPCETLAIESPLPSLTSPAETIVEPFVGAAGGQTVLESSVKSPESAPEYGSDALACFGDYELLRELARGGMGVVYLARQVKLNRMVALKMILSGQFAGSEEIQRFYTEAEAAAHLDHPNIVPIYEVGEHSGQPFFSMGYVEGDSLAGRVAEQPLPPREAAQIVRAVALAVEYAHRQGIVHRDLKPANVLLDRHGQPKITDFGLAKLAGSDSQMTASGQVMGTPSYMPPEQAAGRTHEVGPLSDVYSLGAILYRVLTGRPPFQAASIVETLKQVVEQEPAPPRRLNPGLDPDLETICLKCLAKEPQRRYDSAQALAEDLDRYLSGRPVIARPVGNVERFRRWCRRNPTVAALAALALLFLVGGAGFSTHYAVQADRRAAEAVLEREAADRNFKLARQAVDDFFTRVSEDVLLNQPGLQPLQHELLSQALSYYQRFLDERAEDPSVRDELAATHYRVGLITESLESPERSLASYRKALDVQRQLAAERPADAGSLNALGDTLNAFARALFRSRRVDESRQTYREAADVRDRLVRTAPNDGEFRRKLANAHMNLGLIEKHGGRADEARRLFETAQEARRRLSADRPSPELQRDLSMGAYNLALLDLALGEHEAAKRGFEEAAGLFEDVFREEPRDLTNQYRLAVCQRTLGDLSAAAGDWDEAAAWYDQARERIELLARQNPDVPDYQRELADLCVILAELEFGRQDAAAARRLFERTFAILERLAAEDPESPQYRMQLAVTLREAAVLLESLDPDESTQEWLGTSRRLLRELVDQFPGASDYQEQFRETESEIARRNE